MHYKLIHPGGRRKDMSCCAVPIALAKNEFLPVCVPGATFTHISGPRKGTAFMHEKAPSSARPIFISSKLLGFTKLQGGISKTQALCIFSHVKRMQFLQFSTTVYILRSLVLFRLNVPNKMKCTNPLHSQHMGSQNSTPKSFCKMFQPPKHQSRYKKKKMVPIIWKSVVNNMEKIHLTTWSRWSLNQFFGD